MQLVSPQQELEAALGSDPSLAEAPVTDLSGGGGGGVIIGPVAGFAAPMSWRCPEQALTPTLAPPTRLLTSGRPGWLLGRLEPGPAGRLPSRPGPGLPVLVAPA